jgi:xanthine/uracil permease
LLKFSEITTYLIYGISLIAILFGVIVLSGFAFQNIPPNLKVTCGIVLILWGIYRFISTRIRVRQLKDQEDNE